MKKFIGAVLLLGGFVFAPVVWADGCPMGGGKSCAVKGDCNAGRCEESYPCPIVDKAMKKAHFLLENKEALGLSEQQVKTIKDLKLWMKKNMIRQGAEMEIMMLEMRSKLGEEPLDLEGINAMIDEGSAGMAKAGKATVEAYAKLKSVLTPEQVTKAKAIWSKK